MSEISFVNCSKDAENCTVIDDLIELDSFYEIASTMDERYRETRGIICGLFNACVNGTCPGQEPELLDEFSRKVADARRSDE